MTAFVPNRLTIRDICALSEEKANAFFDRLTPDEQFSKRYDWKFWARDDQLLPTDREWIWWLLLSGRGAGKTRSGAEAVRQWVKEGFHYIALIGATFDDAEKIMVKGESGVLAVCPPDERPVWIKNSKELRWPNGSVSLVFSAEEPDRLRGKQAEKAWCFSEGTMIEVPIGRRPIETIMVSEYVRTRFGLRRVVATGSHVGRVGEIRFSNGATLSCTADHPLLTPYGWMTAASLSIGQSVATDMSGLTSEKSISGENATSSTSIAGFGKSHSGRFLLAMRSTTKTKIHSTTTSVISNVSRILSIGHFMRGSSVRMAGMGTDMISIACAAAPNFESVGERRLRNARHAIDGLQIKRERPSAHVANAGPFSAAERATFAANVVSTWEGEGSSIVYNLTVEGENEFIANGIVVHNCDELACVIGTSKVKTSTGDIPIKDIKSGDLVWTRRGLRPVTASWQSSPSATVWELVTRAGVSLIGTENHPVWLRSSKGFVQLRDLRNGDILEPWRASESYGGGRHGICTEIISAIGKVNCCIAKSSRMLLAQSRAVLKSTILMGINATTNLATWPLFRDLNISGLSQGVASLIGPQIGVNAVPNCSGIKGSRLGRYARNAERGFHRLACGQNFAHRDANKQIYESNIHGLRKIGHIKSATLGFVVNVALGLRRMIGRLSAVQGCAEIDIVESLRKLPYESAVYNISVEGEEEYYANGILVHNSWRRPEAFDHAKLGLRLGRNPQAIITTTPRPTKIIKDLIADKDTIVTRSSTYANKANLSKAFHSAIVQRYEGTRMGRQELYAEMLEDTPGALWRREWFDEEGHRVTYKNLPQLTRIVVAIDPAVTTGEDADETGIICVGIDSRRHAYVLDDRSGHFTVDEWAKKATATYRYRKADCIVAEVNNGGDMVERVLRMHDNSIAYKKVHASRGKVIRAEPVAQLYEKRWVHHLGCFPKLEDQLCFPAGTLIETALGHIPIEKIRFGDLVMTRDGLFPVKIACETGCSSEFVVITTTDGGVLRCTPTHPIFDAETGQFVAAMNAKRGQRLNVRHSPANMAGRSLGVEGGGIECRRAIIGMRRVNYFTARYGRLIRDRFQKECMSIIRMRIHQITHLTTLLCSRLQNMFLSISREELLGSTGKLGCSMGSSHGESGFQKNSSAYIAARLEGACGLQKENSATISALTDIIRRKRSRREIVRSAGKRLWRGTRGRSTAIGDVSNLRTIEESVFNLKVDGPNEFYANGILVHNCSFTSDYIRSKGNSPDRLDALVFAISELLVEGNGYDESLSWIGV